MTEGLFSWRLGHDRLDFCALICFDSQLLADAERQICDSTNQEKEVILMDFTDSDAATSPEPVVHCRTLPEWAQPLEPVRKLPTNVGTRIRKCIYDSLGRNPPEWAKKILEHSISKEVYKGNASGPTKVISYYVVVQNAMSLFTSTSLFELVIS